MLVFSKVGDGVFTSDFVIYLNYYIEQPVDMIFFPCHGKTAIPDLKSLPIGSNIIIFSDSDKNSLFNIIENLLNNYFRDEYFTLTVFYDNYLYHLEKIDENPILVMVQEDGYKIIDPHSLAKKYLGQSISYESRDFIHKNLGHNICRDESCYVKLDRIMDKIEISTNIEQFYNNTSYKEMNDILYLLYADYQFKQNSYHLEITSYNYQDVQFCFVEVIDLKQKIDLLFYQNKVPLEFNLESIGHYKYNEDYSDYQIPQNITDLGFFELLKGDFFKETDTFFIPESSDYGLLLAIVKNIDQSLYTY